MDSVLQLEAPLRVAGPLFFIAIQFASVKSARKIWIDKSTSNLPILPFLSLFTNCMIWTFYGLLKSDMTLVVPSAIGISSGFFCTLTYLLHAEVKIFNYAISLGACTLISFCSILYFYRSEQLLGAVGVIISVVLLASPLSSLATVIKDKSTASLPFSTTLCMTLNALSWMSYGFLVVKDKMVWFPNLLGSAFCFIQLSLFLIYGFPPNEKYATHSPAKDFC